MKDAVEVKLELDNEVGYLKSTSQENPPTRRFGSLQAFAAIAALTLMGYYCLYSHFQVQDMKVQLGFAEQKEKIDNDQIRDLMDAVREKERQQEVVKGQGYVAGILDAIKREDHYMTIWHDGYNRGSEVREQVAEAFLKQDVKNVSTEPVK